MMRLTGVVAAVLAVAAAIYGAHSAQVEDCGGIRPTVTAEEALAAVVEWADWLGIRALTTRGGVHSHTPMW